MSDQILDELRQSCERSGRLEERRSLIEWAMRQSDADAKMAIVRYLEETNQNRNE